MKKFRLFFVVLGIMLILSGCKNGEEQSPVENPQQNQEQTVVKVSQLKDKIFSMSRVCSYVGDVDGDGTDEEVILATSAECNEDGEFLWNDGQDWALYVHDRTVDYLLFDEYINAGNVYFEVSDYYMDNGAEPRINVIVSTGAGFSVKSYGFSKEKDGYVETDIYNTKGVTKGGINRRFSSIPDYEEEF